MTHRPYTLITYRLIVSMQRSGMTRKQIALDLNMSEDAVRMCVNRMRGDRRKKPRPDSIDRREPNVN